MKSNIPPEKNFVGRALEDIRTYKGLSQVSAAKLTGLSQGQWSNHESGKTHMSLDKAIQISSKLGISAFAFIILILDRKKFTDHGLYLSIEDCEELTRGVETFRKNKIAALIEKLSE